MDPGNWVTDLEGGAKFGYRLLWVLVMSNVMAIFLQNLAARLGVVTGQDLAQACRDAYPRPISLTLWVLCEIAIAACDLAEVLGAAIGLNLLFQIPILSGILITVGDTLILLWLQQFRIRSLELIIVRLIVIIGACLGMEVFLARPEPPGMLAGLIPHLDRSSLFASIAILGATVMPHNLYLHSALVQSRRVGTSTEAKRIACRYNLIDTLIALNGAMFINIAILVLAASVFFTRGVEINQIQQAVQLLEPLLGNKAAGIIFAVALLCAGQAATLTGTLAGQTVMEGFLNIRMRAWLRRLATRSIAIVPAAVTVYFAGDKGAYELLILTQAVLGLQLPFAVIPLIRFTGQHTRMGEFTNSSWIQWLAWLVAGINLILNLWLARLNLDEWLAFEGVYGTAIAIITIALITVIVLLLLYVWFAPLRESRRQGPSIEGSEESLDTVMFMDTVGADQQIVQRISAFMTHMQGIAFIKDPAGRYVFLGGASSEVLGIDPQRAILKLDEDLWPPDIARVFRNNDQVVLRQLKRVEGIELIPRNGEMQSWLICRFPIIERASQAVFVGGIGINITDRARSEAQLRNLATRLHTLREKERDLTSREIHDIGQVLTALDLHLSMIGQGLSAGADRAALAVSLGAASELLASTISSSARISRELRPSMPDNLGLAAAIRWRAGEIGLRSGIRIIAEPLEHIPLHRDISAVLFRLFQGVLTNVEAHSQATEVQIALYQRGDHAVLSVRDDGRGLAAKDAGDPEPPGLIEMRELTLLYGGKVSIDGAPGQGTTVSVQVPIHRPALPGAVGLE